MHIAIMQGRLVPPSEGRIQCFPRERWRDEFALAAAAGLDAIEWIYDLYGADVNPIATDDGLAQIRALSAQSGVQVRSLCADYFMDRPLLRARAAEIEERTETLVWLLGRCAMLGMGRVVLPFVDASRIDSDAELDDVVDRPRARAARPRGDGRGAAPGDLALARDDSPTCWRGCRTPCSRSTTTRATAPRLGTDPTDEFAAYGGRVGSVHIKDRVHGGGTVPLGSGDTDFRALFQCLGEVGYAGDFVLQVARGTTGDEVAWARKNRDFVLAHLAGSA